VHTIECSRADVAEGRPLDVDLAFRVLMEFREMPGLSITLSQAARLFNVDAGACAALLDALVNLGLLSTDGSMFRSIESEWRHA